MATIDTVVQELVVNTLSHAQFKEAQEAGTLSPYELYGTPDTSFRLPVLTPMWFDHITDDVSWLRADTFSWQSGDVYVAAYNHLAGEFPTEENATIELSDGTILTRNASADSDGYLAWSSSAFINTPYTKGLPKIGGAIWFYNDQAERYEASQSLLYVNISGGTYVFNTDTIGDITITYYLAEDGHKICLPDQEANITALYEATGVAWYYLLDTDNKQFKLPRTKYGFVGSRDGVGNYVPESLPNIKGYPDYNDDNTTNYRIRSINPTGAYVKHTQTNVSPFSSQATSTTTLDVVSFDASASCSTYQDNAPVQQRATQMYLYFYVGNFEQSAIEQTAGITSETLNGKADLNLANITDSGRANIANIGMPSGTYINLTLGASGTSYTAPADGWFCVQKVSGGAGLWLAMTNQTGRISTNMAGQGSDNNLPLYVPAKAGDIINITYTATGTTNSFLFVYAEGAKHLAS